MSNKINWSFFTGFCQEGFQKTLFHSHHHLPLSHNFTQLLVFYSSFWVTWFIWIHANHFHFSSHSSFSSFHYCPHPFSHYILHHNLPRRLPKVYQLQTYISAFIRFDRLVQSLILIILTMAWTAGAFMMLIVPRHEPMNLFWFFLA